MFSRQGKGGRPHSCKSKSKNSPPRLRTKMKGTNDRVGVEVEHATELGQREDRHSGGGVPA